MWIRPESAYPVIRDGASRVFARRERDLPRENSLTLRGIETRPLSPSSRKIAIASKGKRGSNLRLGVGYSAPRRCRVVRLRGRFSSRVKTKGAEIVDGNRLRGFATRRHSPSSRKMARVEVNAPQICVKKDYSDAHRGRVVLFWGIFRSLLNIDAAESFFETRLRGAEATILRPDARQIAIAFKDRRVCNLRRDRLGGVKTTPLSPFYRGIPIAFNGSRG